MQHRRICLEEIPLELKPGHPDACAAVHYDVQCTQAHNELELHVFVTSTLIGAQLSVYPQAKRNLTSVFQVGTLKEF